MSPPQPDRRAGDADRLAALEQQIAALPKAFEEAFRAVLSDEELISDFWQRGYHELTDHAGNGASQWIGKRILTAVVAAMVTAGIVWLVKSGAIK